MRRAKKRTVLAGALVIALAVSGMVGLRLYYSQQAEAAGGSWLSGYGYRKAVEV
jgi:hypothetical protein